MIVHSEIIQKWPTFYHQLYRHRLNLLYGKEYQLGMELSLFLAPEIQCTPGTLWLWDMPCLYIVLFYRL